MASAPLRAATSKDFFDSAFIVKGLRRAAGGASSGAALPEPSGRILILIKSGREGSGKFALSTIPLFNTRMKTTTDGQPAARSGNFSIGGDVPVHRLGFGAMRITGDGVWGEPADRQECLAVLRRAVELG